MQRARDIMSGPVISVTPNTPVTEVARTLLDNDISGCPVIDEVGRMRGIVSRANLLDHALGVEGGALTPVLRFLVPGGGEEADFEEAYAPLRADDYEVPAAQEIMTPDVIVVKPDLPLEEVARLMSRERIHRVPVVEGGRVVGIITSLDLLAVFPEHGSREKTESGGTS